MGSARRARAPRIGDTLWEDRVLDVAFLALTLAVFTGLLGLIKGLERL